MNGAQFLGPSESGLLADMIEDEGFVVIVIGRRGLAGGARLLGVIVVPIYLVGECRGVEDDFGVVDPPAEAAEKVVGSATAACLGVAEGLRPFRRSESLNLSRTRAMRLAAGADSG